jgi:hypothetical protein
MLDGFFGNVETFDFNRSKETEAANPFFFSEARILQPSKKDYIFAKKWIRQLSDDTLAKYGEGRSFTTYNALLVIIAAMELCIDDVKMEEWQSDPVLQFLNNAGARKRF